MAEELKERSQMDPQFEWDLRTLFQNDGEWEEEFQSLDELIMKVSSYKGKLKDADSILACLRDSSDLSRTMENVFTYTSLRHSEDTRANDAQSMYTRAYGKYVTAMSAVAFIEPEILSLDEEKLTALCSDEKLKDYRFQLEDLLRRKPHTLNAAEEELLATFGEALATPSLASDALMDADMKFEDAKDEKGEAYPLSNSTYILLQNSLDRTLRRDSFQKFYKSYQEHINTLTSTYAGAVKGAVAEAKVRKYSSSRQMMMSQDNIPETVYDNLIRTVHEHMDTMYRYVRLRKRLLKLDELHYYDVYTPLTSGTADRYTYEEAQQMVLDAVKPLGENYQNIVKGAFRDRWIDVYPNKGKSSGAYSSGTYDSNPYILTNFTGTLDSVSTIAHEMGHSLHSYHTNHAQPFHYANYSLFVAEVASTVNENLLIEQLLQKENDPAKRLVLLNQYMEGFKGTVYRQTMFAEFEKEAHAMAERGESLDPSALSALYENLIRQYFGDDLVMDEEVKYEWARIPHFYRPFYVYVYATGYSTAVALSEKILHGGETAVQKYLEFLSMGASAYPLDELKHAGVDLTTPEPIAMALEKFARIVDDAERTADALGL